MCGYVLGANFRETELLLALVVSLFAELDFLLVVEDCLLTAVCTGAVLLFTLFGPAASEYV